MSATKEIEKELNVGQRGPVEHERRDQIIKSADEHFRKYGYSKTTVSDLSKAIGVSSAYIYRFFESKQAIGEAICAMTLGRIGDTILEIANSDQSASSRIRKLYKAMVDKGFELFFNDRKLHDIVIAAIDGKWSSVVGYKEVKLGAIRKIVVDGRESGEFERKTPLDETCLAILETLAPFAHPILLEQNDPEGLHESASAVSSLVLRSLAP